MKPSNKPCEACGQPIVPTAHLQRKARFCSEECRRVGVGTRNKVEKPRLGKYRTGGRFITNGGYRFVHLGILAPRVKTFAEQMNANNTSALATKYIQEHRAVMADKLNRPLESWEQVHHKDGDKLNNAPENLELWIGNHGNAQRITEIKCPHCGKPYSDG